MQKSMLASLIVAVLVFIIKYTWDYRVISERIKIDPINSFPPSAAWITALPWAVGTFIFILLLNIHIWPQQLKFGIYKEKHNTESPENGFW